MAKIFVSYRREDSAGHVGRLQERLRTEFGKKNVFVDVANIDAGTDFEDAIEKAVAASKVLIAVIGKDWLSAKDAQGQRRIDNQRDYVRLELEKAFHHNLKVIPVLVRGAEMPKAADLPESLQKLARLHAVELRDTRWDADTPALLRVAGGPWPLRKIRRHKWKSTYVLLFALVVPLVFYLTQAPVDNTEQFLIQLAKGNMQEAYLATSSNLRQQIDEKAFVREIRRLGLHENASASWSSRSISNGRAELSGTVTTKQRTAIPLTITLIKEDGEWKVFSLKSEAGITGEVIIGPNK